MARSRDRRRGLGCFVLCIMSLLVIHQGSYLGSVYNVILVPVIQDRQVSGCSEDTTTNPNADHLQSSMPLARSGANSNKRTWQRRIVYLHSHEAREFHLGGQSVLFEQEMPTYLRITNSNDVSIRPPNSIPWVPLNSTTAEPIEGGSANDCQPIAPWQTLSFPNCNTFHEADFLESMDQFLNLGEYRDVWKIYVGLDEEELGYSKSFALKTLR